jgi:hypothetical protein
MPNHDGQPASDCRRERSVPPFTPRHWELGGGGWEHPFAYHYGGAILRSGILLPELPETAPDASVTLPWDCGPARQVPDRPWRQEHEWRDDAGGDWLRIERASSSFRLTFAIGPTFFVEDRSIAWVDGGAAPDTVRHLLLDQVLPLAMSTSRVFGLHASAVDTDDGAVAFVGSSGVGKSTLAARFARDGSPVLADDYVALDERERAWWAHGAYPGLRLWRDVIATLGVEETTPVAAYTSKQRTTVPVASGPRRVRRLYLLNRVAATAPVTVTPARAAEVTAIIRCAFRLDLTDRAGLASDFAGAAALIEYGLVRRLGVPHDFMRLDDVIEAIVEDVRASGC